MIHAAGDGQFESGQSSGGRGRWLPWVVLGLVVALLGAGTVVVLAVTVLDRIPGAFADGNRPGARTAAPSPRPGDPLPVARAWLRERIAEQLDRQAEALLRGDEKGFLAIVEPGSPAVADLRRQFRVLRALRVTNWRPELHEDPKLLDAKANTWRILVTYQHCFVTPDCPVGPVLIGSQWLDRGKEPRLVAVEPSGFEEYGPRPWEVSDLAVSIGERTMVATTPKHRAELPTLLAEAERAALLADRYAVDGRPPVRYRIFYAGPAEWRKWYGGDRSEWTAGYALPAGGGEYELVLNADTLHRSHLDNLLRHELTHAASLPDEGYQDESFWWLVEGIAEYAAGNSPTAADEQLSDVRRLLASGQWTGGLAEIGVSTEAEDWRVSAAYGVGFLVVQQLAERFGEEQLIDFFRAVVHEEQPVDEASREVFGEKWSTLHDLCVEYVRSAAG